MNLKSVFWVFCENFVVCSDSLKFLFCVGVGCLVCISFGLWFGFCFVFGLVFGVCWGVGAGLVFTSLHGRMLAWCGCGCGVGWVFWVVSLLFELRLSSLDCYVVDYES